LRDIDFEKKKVNEKKNGNYGLYYIFSLCFFFILIVSKLFGIWVWFQPILKFVIFSTFRLRSFERKD